MDARPAGRSRRTRQTLQHRDRGHPCSRRARPQRQHHGASMSRDLLAPILAALPSRRASLPSEVAAAVVFLATDDAANIHGATLSIDGGASAT